MVNIVLKRADLPEFDEVVTHKFVNSEDTKKSIICALRKDQYVFFLIANGEIPQRDLVRFSSTAIGNGWSIKNAPPINADKSLIAQLNMKLPTQVKRAGSQSIDHYEKSDVVEMFHDICRKAVAQKASDVFIEYRPESEEDNLVKMRINGIVETTQSIPSSMASSLVAVSYNSLADAGSKIAEYPSFVRTSILNAAINIKEDGLEVGLRAVYMPSYKDGTDLTLRVLPGEDDSMPVELHDLGYEPKQCSIIERMSAKTSGVLIFAGIAGSGKSTTIRSLLTTLRKTHPGKRINLLEDPIEYKIEGINQIPLADIKVKDGGVKEAWAEAVRGLVRANVDILSLGEVRDEITAGEMVDYILTGHQVLTTLHAPSAIGCVQRLERLGINRDIIGGPNFISGFVYQRLLPKLCPSCSIDLNHESMNQVDKALADRLSGTLDLGEAKLHLRNSNGCEKCRKGYIGRVVVAETMLLDNTMRAYIRAGNDSEAFNHWRAHAVKGRSMGHGTTALEHAKLLMERGIVSPIDVEAAFGYIDMQDIEADNVIDHTELNHGH